MNLICPYCGDRLKEGRAEIHGTTLGFFLVGLSYQNLYFKSPPDKKIRILESNCSTSALRCENCEVVILNKDSSDIATPTDDMTFAKITRDNIVNMIELWSSRDSQDIFQRSNPEINIVFDMFIQWVENFRPDMVDFRNSFSKEELNLWLEFDLEIKNIYNQIETDMPNYYDFVETEDWRKLRDSAKSILDKLDK